MRRYSNYKCHECDLSSLDLIGWIPFVWWVGQLFFLFIQPTQRKITMFTLQQSKAIITSISIQPFIFNARQSSLHSVRMIYKTKLLVLLRPNTSFFPTLRKLRIHSVRIIHNTKLTLASFDLYKNPFLFVLLPSSVFLLSSVNHYSQVSMSTQVCRLHRAYGRLFDLARS